MLTLNQIFIESLEQRTKNLQSIVRRERDLIGCGSNSLALSDTHHSILLITDRTNARKIEAFIEKAQLAKSKGKEIPASLLLPTLIGVNEDLSALINPTEPDQVKTQLNFRTKYLKSSIWRDNVVYRLDKFDGSLEDFDSVRYKEDTVATIVTEVAKCLDFMHEIGFTHNDVAERNILYKGEYPHLTFCLSDLGSATLNIEDADDTKALAKHHAKAKKDITRLGRLEERLLKQLNAKPGTPQKKLPSPSKKAKEEGRVRRQATIRALKMFDEINHKAKQEPSDSTDEFNFRDIKPIAPTMIVQKPSPKRTMATGDLSKVATRGIRKKYTK